MKLFSSICIAVLASSAFGQQFGSGRPVVTSSTFRPWAESYVQQAIASCPVARATTIYVSNSGNDSNPGTISAPIKTIARADSFVAFNSNVAILLHSGETFQTSFGFYILQPDVTIASYRTATDPPVLARPVITCFQSPVATTGWTADPTTGVYTTPVSGSVAWMHYTGDNETVFTLTASYSDCAATPGSWYQSGNVLYVHNFDNLALNTGDRRVEFVYKNQAEGIYTSDVDNIRINNLVIEGFGAGTAGDQSYNGYAIEGDQVGTHRIVVTNTETYYNGRHSIAKVGTLPGGSLVVANCRMGWLVNDNINVVSYSTDGGQELVACNNEFLGAQLPTGIKPYSYAGSGTTVLAHATGTNTCTFFLCMDNSILPGQFQNDLMETCACAPAFTDLAQCAAFVVGSNAPSREQTLIDLTKPSANNGDGLTYYNQGCANTVFMGCTVQPKILWTYSVGDCAALLNAAGIWINSTITFDFRSVPANIHSDNRTASPVSGNLASFNSSYYNCQIKFLGGKGSGNYGFSGPMIWTHGAQSLAQAWQGQMMYCSLDCIGVGAGTFKPGFANDGVSMQGNAYPGFSVTSGAWGMDQDPSPFVCDPGQAVSPTPPGLEQPIIMGYALQFDKLYRLRNAISAVGAFEISN